MGEIKTYSGIMFDPLNPREELIRIGDIAHALSMLCRANGHFKSFYSVGQHCINCAREAGAEKQMEEQFTEPLKLIFREGNPTSVKVMTAAMGLTRDEVRLPLVEGSEELSRDIKAAIAKYDLR